MSNQKKITTTGTIQIPLEASENLPLPMGLMSVRLSAQEPPPSITVETEVLGKKYKGVLYPVEEAE